MRTIKAKKIFIIDLLITLIITLLIFLSRKFFIDNMGVQVTGLMQLMVQMISYLGITEMGLGTAATYMLYKPLAENNQEKLNEIIGSVKRNYEKISLLILVIGILLFPFLLYVIDFSLSKKIVFIYWCLYVLNTAISYKFAYIVILLTADQKYYKVKLIQGISKILILLLQIIVIVKLKSFLIFLLIEFIFIMIQYILFNILVNKEYEIKPVKKYVNLFKDTIFVFFHQLSGLIVFNTDYIIISKFISLLEVTLYSNYLQIVNALNLFVTILVTSLTAGVGDYLNSEKKENSKELFKSFYMLFSYLATVITIITYFLIDKFIESWLGKEYILDKRVIYFILINLFILILRKSIDIFKGASGFFKDIYLPISEASLNLGVSILLVNKMGLIGVIIGTTISNLIVIILLRPLITLKYLFNELPKFYLSLLIKTIVYFGIICVITKLLKFHFEFLIIKITNFYTFFILGGILALEISIIGLLVYLIDEKFRQLIKKILKII